MESGAPVIFQLGPRWDIMVQQRVRTDSWPFQVRHGALKNGEPPGPEVHLSEES